MKTKVKRFFNVIKFFKPIEIMFFNAPFGIVFEICTIGLFNCKWSFSGTLLGLTLNPLILTIKFAFFELTYNWSGKQFTLNKPYYSSKLKK